MKILHILSTSKWTGPANYILDIGEFLQKNNIDFLLLFRTKPEGNLEKFANERGINFSKDLILYKKFNPFYFFHDILNLKRIVKRFNPDIVHVHFSTENIIAGFLKNREFKLIRSIHNSKNLKKNPFSNRILKSNDFIHTVCNDYKEKLIKNFGIEMDKIFVINGWVDEKVFSPEGRKDFLKDRFGVPDDKIKIGMVARFQPHRGHEFLLRAFKELNSKEVVLVFTGKGEYLENIRKLTEQLNLREKVIFTGYIKDELPDLLRSLDIFVLLEEGSDGSCRAILEAMGCGLPVIGVNKGGMKEAIVNGKNGFIIPKKDDIGKLKEKLQNLIESSELRKKFGEVSRKIVEERFSKEKNLNRFLNFYRMVKEND